MSENLDINVTDSGSARRVAKDVRDIGPAAIASDKSVQLLNTGLGKLAGAVAGIASARVFLESLGVADDINDKLSLVVGTTGELSRVQDQLFESSQRTGTQLSSNANLYAGLSQALGGTITDQNRLMNVTELVSKSLVVQGKSAGDVSGVMARFVAQLQQGEISGRGLTGVLTQFPELTNAIAVGLGVTTQQLVEMGKQGQLSTQMIIQGLERSAAFIEGRFQVAAGGLTDSFNRLTNSIVDFAGKSGLLDFITGWLDTMAKGIQVITILWLQFRKAMAGTDEEVQKADTAIKNYREDLAKATQTGVKGFDQLQKETDALNKKFGVLGATGEDAMARTARATDRASDAMSEYNAVTAQATAITTGFDASVRGLEAAASAAADAVDSLSSSQQRLDTSTRGTDFGAGGRRGGTGGGPQELGTGFAESFIQRQLSMFDQQAAPLQEKLLRLELKQMQASSDARREMIKAEADAVSEAINRINIRKQLAELNLRRQDLSRITIQQVLGFDTSNDVRMQHGGQFQVKGGGGIDSKLVKFWASPGETVNVKTRSQQKQDVKREVNNTFNLGSVVINTPDVAGFARSRQQFRLELLNDLRDVARKAGLDDLP